MLNKQSDQASALESGFTDKDSHEHPDRGKRAKGSILKGTIHILDENEEMSHFERKASLINE